MAPRTRRIASKSAERTAAMKKRSSEKKKSAGKKKKRQQKTKEDGSPDRSDTPLPKSLINVTNDTEGLEEHKKGYDVVTVDKLDEFTKLLNESNADAGFMTAKTPTKGGPSSPSTPEAVDTDDDADEVSIKDSDEDDDEKSLSDDTEDESEEEVEEPDDKSTNEEEKEEKEQDMETEEKDDDTKSTLLSKDPVSQVLQKSIKKTPIPSATTTRSKEVPILMTDNEAHALDMLSKNVGGISDREAAIFLHGYRLRGDHNIKTMEAILKSMNQSVNVLASQNRNIKHTANALSDEIKAGKKTAVKVEKGPSKEQQKKAEDQMKTVVTNILELANTSIEQVFKSYDLSVSQIYDAIQPVVKSLSRNEYDFVGSDDWPENLMALLFEKKKHLYGTTSSSGMQKKKASK